MEMLAVDGEDEPLICALKKGGETARPYSAAYRESEGVGQLNL